MASYTRQSTFSDGDLITAELFNDEYNQLLAAFENTTGHKHDGTVGEGPVISIIGDAGLATPLNKILIDTTNDHIEFWVDVSGTSTQQLYITDGAILPVTDNDIDLGSNSLQFKDLYINGTANIDTVDIDAGTIDGVTIGGNSAGAITGTTITATNFVIGSASINETELEILDGATLTTTELNYVDGVTSSIQTQIDTKAPLASPSLTGIPTAPTAASNTNTTQIATTAYVQSELTDLIDGAPGTLDTLNELAAAINDDANYNTTLTTALATKLPLAGGTMTGDVTYSDNVKAQFGTSQDLLIYHDGSNSFITDGGTGDLKIRSNKVRIEAPDSQNMIIVTEDAGFSSYYNGTKRLEVTNTGIDVTGSITTDGVSVDGNINLGDNDSIYLGDSNDLRIYHDSGSSLIRNTTGSLYIQDDDGHVYIRPKSGQDGLVAIADGAVTLHHSGNAKIATTSSGIDVTGTVVSDGLEARKDTGSTTNSLLKLTNSAGSTTDGVGITFEVANTSGAGGSVNVVRDGSNFKPYMTLNTSANVSTTPSQRVRIDDTGIDVTGTVTADGLTVNSGATLINGSIANAPTGDGVHLGLTSNYAQMQLNGSAGGIIDFSTSGVDSIGRILYDQTSDYMRFDTNYSERMRLDSSGRLGIGTTSPNTPLDVRRSDASGAVAEFHNNVGYGIDIGTSTTDAYISSGYNQNFIFKTNAGSGQTERIRIDSSGNFLVGKTASDFTVAGHEMKPSSFAAFTRNGGTPLIVNRLSSDGDIIEFYKGTSSVGSIGTMNFGDMYLGTDDTGIYFNNGIDSISPINTTNQTVRDNAIDLGASNARFKDLYLSGTANFGSLSDGTITITGFVDEDNMSSNSATLVPTQQSVKAYVDSQVSSAGGNGISFEDNEKAQFGDDNDLQIYHDGSHSYIQDSGSGNLRILVGDMQIRNYGTNENIITSTANAEVALYYNASEKLATTSTGIDVTGTVKGDGLIINGGATSPTHLINGSRAGTLVSIDNESTSTSNGLLLNTASTNANSNILQVTSNDLNRFKVAGNGDISFYDDTGSTQGLFWDASAESLGIGETSPDGKLHIKGGTATGDASHVLFENTQGSKVFAIGGGASGVTNNNLYIRNVTDNTTPMVITDAGNATFAGTITGDGLTVAGSNANLILGTTGNDITFTRNGDNYIHATGGTSSNIIINPQNRFVVNTGGSERARIDSSGRLGLGTTSPSSPLSVHSALPTGHPIAEFRSTGNVNATIDLRADGTGDPKIFFDLNGATPFAIGVDNSDGDKFKISGNYQLGTNDRFVIDASGNAMLGKTSVDAGATQGFEFRADLNDLLYLARAGNAITLNRLSSDGDIALFRKDGTTVGSIGVDSTDNLYIAGSTGSTKGIYFNDAGVIPATTGGGVVDNAVDLGQSGYRFKDLYLSGNVNASAAYIDGHIYHTGDTDTYINYSTDNIILSAGGPVMHIKGSGRVGIGTTSPSAKLEVKSSGSNADEITLVHSGNTAKIASLGQESSHGSLILRNNSGVNQVRLSAGGNDSYLLNSNFGIGVTSPSALLHIQSENSTTNDAVNMMILTALSTGTTTTGFGPAILLQGERNNGVMQNVGRIRSIAEVNSGTNISSGLAFETSTAGVLNERVRISYDGKVGIGTASPSEKLEIANNASVNMKLNNTGQNITLEIGAQSSAARITAGSGDRLGLGAGNTQDILNIASGGNVGIGDTAPQDYLEINGSGKGLGGLTISNSSASHAALSFARSSTATARIKTSEPAALHTSALHFQTSDASGGSPNLLTAMYIDENQRVGIGTTSPNVLADLHVADTTDARIWLDATSGNTLELYAGSGVGLFNRSNSFLNFGTDNVERMRIDSTGRLLVGTTSVGYSGVDLTVGATTDSQNGVSIQTSTTGIGYLLFGDGTGASAYVGQIAYAHSDNSMQFDTAGAERMRILASGDTVIRSGNKLVLNRTDNAIGGEMDYVAGTGFVFNDANGDGTSFKVGASTRLRLDSSGNVGIGKTPSGAKLDVTTPTTGQLAARFANTHSSGSYGISVAAGDDSGNYSASFTDKSGNSLMYIRGDGNVGIGTTSPVTPLHVSTAKSSVTDSVLTLQDTTETFGKMIEFVGQGSTDCRGIIGFQEPQSNAPELYITNGGTEATGSGVGLAFWQYISTARIAPCDSLGDYRDDEIDLGWSNARFDDIYATNGTIQTSDRNDKQDIQALTAAETRVATACKGLLRKFRWQDAVTEKGDEARYHFGIIAQDLQDAFTAEGLDAGDYGMFISQTWEDSNGVEQTRLGVRYSELLAFIIAAI